MDKNHRAQAVNIFCLCHGAQKMAEITPKEGIEVVSRHHGTYHIGSLSVRELLTQLSGTTNGSAIIDFVRTEVAHG